ncbi:hypothetical protein A2U01_0062760, partial [Trifolium medium]|nr:hypothetical protein [Trifolium medium]
MNILLAMLLGALDPSQWLISLYVSCQLLTVITYNCFPQYKDNVLAPRYLPHCEPLYQKHSSAATASSLI